MITVRELIRNYEESPANFPHNKFFTKESLRFFGETIGSMKVLPQTMHIVDVLGEDHECYVLRSYQRNSPHTDNKYYYHAFDAKTFEHIDSKHHTDEF